VPGNSCDVDRKENGSFFTRIEILLEKRPAHETRRLSRLRSDPKHRRRRSWVSRYTTSIPAPVVLGMRRRSFEVHAQLFVRPWHRALCALRPTSSFDPTSDGKKRGASHCCMDERGAKYSGEMDGTNRPRSTSRRQREQEKESVPESIRPTLPRWVARDDGGYSSSSPANDGARKRRVVVVAGTTKSAAKTKAGNFPRPRRRSHRIG